MLRAQTAPNPDHPSLWNLVCGVRFVRRGDKQVAMMTARGALPTAPVLAADAAPLSLSLSLSRGRRGRRPCDCFFYLSTHTRRGFPEKLVPPVPTRWRFLSGDHRNRCCHASRRHSVWITVRAPGTPTRNGSREPPPALTCTAAHLRPVSTQRPAPTARPPAAPAAYSGNGLRTTSRRLRKVFVFLNFESISFFLLKL